VSDAEEPQRAITRVALRSLGGTSFVRAVDTAGSPGRASGLTHRVRELVGVQVVAGVDGGLTFAVSGQQLRVREHRDRLLQRVEICGLMGPWVATPM
jgi:hypothetical protein